METPITISKKPPAHKSMDYEFLRKKGMKYISELSGKLWTDYNIHDPGITIMELLCYAISDLGYRTSLPIKDLLAAEKNNLRKMKRQFPTAKSILRNGPVTFNDYRKLLMDISAVRNAWLKKATKTYYVDCETSKIQLTKPPVKHQSKTIELGGLYDILIETREELGTLKWRQLQEKIKSVYHANRNLCEDLSGSIRKVPVFRVKVCADVELEADADVEAVQAAMLFRIDQYLRPPVYRYTLKQLLEKGKRPKEIFNGPDLRFGFIDDDELVKSKLRTTVQVSDLMGIFMQIKGVKAVKKVLLNKCQGASSKVGETEKWTLSVPKNHQPRLCKDESVFNFFKDLLPFRPDLDEVDSILENKQAIQKAAMLSIKLTEDDLPMPLGKFRNVSQYHSIQNDFPKVFGTSQIGVITDGLNDDEKRNRIALARQLKGYLLFFDQILANYLSQLENLKSLFSTKPGIWKTYFSQAILPDEIRDIEALYVFYEKYKTHSNYKQATSDLDGLTGERAGGLPTSKFFKRRNQILNHLLARFAENFNEYVLLMHSMMREKRNKLEIIQDKERFLREYEQISHDRAKAIDFYNTEYFNSAGKPILNSSKEPLEKKLWYSQSEVVHPRLVNVSGFQHRIARLAGINNYKTRNLSIIRYDIYEESDSDADSEPRWRIFDVEKNKILLSASKHYENPAEAQAEMRKAVELGQMLNNYQLLTADDGRFYFNIINESEEVVARRIEYFDTQTERLAAIHYLINFLQENFSEEGFFVFEHLLLRPLQEKVDHFLPVCTEGECKECDLLDPYSFRVEIILPGYTPRFSNMDFRRYFEKMIHRELPAHILPKVCWIGENQMGELEVNYRKWLEYHRKATRKGKPTLANRSLNKLIETLNKLYTIYPKGILHDCDDGNDENPIVLGKTHIGNLDDNDLSTRPN